MSNDLIQIILTVLVSIAGSSGIWTIVLKRIEKKDLVRKVLIGMGHDRIIYLGMLFIERGEITQDEYENLHDYLYLPYKELGGNGAAERVINDVKKLPIVRAPSIRKKEASE